MNKIKNIILVSLLGSLFSGCGVYSKYQSPEADIAEVTDGLYDYIEASEDTTNIASVAWQEFFTDPFLQSLIEQGLENNTDLNVARLSVEQAEIVVKTARLAYVPSVNLNPTGSINWYKDQTYKSYSITASASWEIDLFGKLRNAKKSSQMALEQSKAYRQAVQTGLIATIANSYYTLVTLDEQLKISRQTLANWEQNLQTMQALKDAGRINQLSVFQTEANKIALEGSVVAIEAQIKALENSISTLLAVTPQKIERGSINSVSFPADLAVGVPLQLLGNRPDVRVAEYSLAQAFYATNQARSSLYPSITLSGSAGFTNSYGAITNPGDMLYSLVGSLLQPIFNAGSLRAQLNISKSQQEQALLQFKQAVLDAGAEVNTALIQWQDAKTQLDIDQNQISVLEQALNNSELLMEHGSADYLDILTAQLSLLQAELSYTTNKFAEIQGVIDLYRALGGGE